MTDAIFEAFDAIGASILLDTEDEDQMAQLSEQEVEALLQLKGQFEASVGYIDEILKNKFFPKQEESNAQYLVRDWTTKYDGYQNGEVVRWLDTVVELHKKLSSEDDS